MSKDQQEEKSDEDQILKDMVYDRTFKEIEDLKEKAKEFYTSMDTSDPNI